MLLATSGCSPYRTAIPASMIRPNSLDSPRSSQEPVNYARLCQPRPDVYQLAPRDVLAVYIEGVLPGDNPGAPSMPPVNYFDADQDLPPSIGYPIVVREDGTIALPLVPPISVTGLSVSEAEYAVRKAYTVDRRLLRAEAARIIVTLMVPRTYNLLVIREDLGGQSPTAGGVEPQRQDIVVPVRLRAYENDLLHALSESGGLPGNDAKNEVIILHGASDTPEMRAQARGALEDPLTRKQFFAQFRNITRVPLRINPKDPPVSLSTNDIILQRGDIVFVESREAEVFYTGGLLPGSQFSIPRDYDLDVLGAISIAGGGLAAGVGGNAHRSYGSSSFTPTPLASLLPPTQVIVIRKGREQLQTIKLDIRTALTDPKQRILIQPNDLIMLEYTDFAMVMNTILSTISFDFDVNQLFSH
jgi:protein involved in polysaccharide export with SLBB domain